MQKIAKKEAVIALLMVKKAENGQQINPIHCLIHCLTST